MGWLQCPPMDLGEEQKFKRRLQPPALCTSTHEVCKVNLREDRHGSTEMQQETKEKQTEKEAKDNGKVREAKQKKKESKCSEK